MEKTLFKNSLCRFTDLSDEEFDEYLSPVLQIRSFEKKQLISRVGEVDNYINYISRGLVRKFYTKNNKEYNVQISCERQLILNMESFTTRKPSGFSIEAVESTVLVSFSHADLENIFIRSHKLEHLARKLLTYAMVSCEHWDIKLVRENPRERFLSFVTRHPELVQRVPQKLLASYLNIKPETFSRFKHLLRNYSPQLTS